MAKSFFNKCLKNALSLKENQHHQKMYIELNKDTTFEIAHTFCHFFLHYNLTTLCVGSLYMHATFFKIYIGTDDYDDDSARVDGTLTEGLRGQKTAADNGASDSCAALLLLAA